jgi:hypothetical protein
MTPEQAAYLKTLEPPNPYWGGMGARELSVDPRDWYARHDPVIAQMLATGAPDSFSLLPYVTGPAYNQQQTGACVSASTCGLCSTDAKHFQDKWTVYHWLNLYHEAGGTGSNGVDTRLVLKICTDQGTPLAVGGRDFIIGSYDFITQAPGVFREEVKACIASGYPVTVALLLPSDFGWQSGQPSAGTTTGYHQVCAVAYDSDYVIILNSWGNEWSFAGAPRPGVGSVRWSFIEQSGLQNRYAYGYRTTYKGGITPPPTPPVVTSYQPNPVGSGKAFSIQGAHFDQGSLSVTFQGQALPVTGVNPDAIATQAPAVQQTTSGPVVVSAGGNATSGPPLTVQADTPIPPVKDTYLVSGRYTSERGEMPPPAGSHTTFSGATTPGDFLVLTVTKEAEPPPGLSVTGYSPNPVKAGASFVIQGQGFTGGNLTVLWQGAILTATRLSDAQIQATAPSAPTTATGPVTVRVEGATADGPPLTVQAGDTPPVGDIKVMVTGKPSQLRNTVSVICYTADKNGNSLPASVSGTVTGSQGVVQLMPQTTHGTQSPSIWTVQRPSPWGQPCQIVVTAAGTGGTSGVGTATG